MSYGTVAIGGETFEISHITLGGGQVIIHWMIPPGHRPFKGAVIIYGPDGRKVCTGSVMELDKPNPDLWGCQYGLSIDLIPRSDVTILRPRE